jgi:hypothetical protein
MYALSETLRCNEVFEMFAASDILKKISYQCRRAQGDKAVTRERVQVIYQARD